ncbi:MAG TPA: sugar ABC transporter ATP-binding protein [Solirubrobacteraceae bacterium]|nr:sugar ABC transporter ATP-binding protein [Solirubrobacteraceae bacterium]
MDTGEDLVLTGVHKLYGPAVVLDLDHVVLRRGEVVGLIGENGAGKSTMMGVVAGSVTPNAGTVSIAGNLLGAGGTLEAQELGVAMVSQEFPLVGQLSVTENLLLGRRASERRVLLDRRAMDDAAKGMLATVGLDVQVRRRVDSLSVAQRQMLEIAKALGRKPHVLILDEPTSALGPGESARVLELARQHATGGGVVIFVGHRLHEVREVADRIIVLRNGKLVADLTPAEATEQRLVREMVGMEILTGEGIAAPAAGATLAFEARALEAEGLGPLDLTLRHGEVVGIAGLMGSGRSRLLHVVMGARASTHGTMELDGANYHPHSPLDAVNAGVGLVPEDRKSQALLIDASIRWNVTLAILRRISLRRFLLTPAADRREAAGIVKRARVRCRTPEQPAGSLSGGNQQRMIFGRWMAARPRLLLLDEPTRGVDVGAKAEIYKLIEESRKEGMAILVASSELEELIGICHRIVVLRRGRITAQLERSEFSKERIIAAAAIDRAAA